MDTEYFTTVCNQIWGKNDLIIDHQKQAEPLMQRKQLPIPRLGRIEILRQSSLDLGNFLARYVCQRVVFWYLVLKRHFLLILKVLYVCLKSLHTVSVSESPTQIFCIGTSLAQFDLWGRLSANVASEDVVWPQVCGAKLTGLLFNYSTHLGQGGARRGAAAFARLAALRVLFTSLPPPLSLTSPSIRNFSDFA